MPHLPNGSNAAVEEQFRRASADLQRRLLAGESCRSEEYLTSFPLLGADPQAALDLLYDEYLTRVRLMQQALAEEFLQRFPYWSDSLERQFQFHAWLEPVLAQDSTRPLSTLDNAPPCSSASAKEEAGWASSYDILHEVARGGMGVVYKAWQRNLGRVVAIKTIRKGSGAEAAERRRLRTEASALARLQHPNIVQIHEAGQREDLPYLVLEFVDGGTLAGKLACAPLPAGEAARLVRTLAAAAHHAHQQGVLHRDLTPANILLTRDGVPKISDFGLAKLLDGEDFNRGHAGQRAAGPSKALLGTPGYMAPEQADGKEAGVGPAADVYTLGALLYEALTGRPPFRSKTLFGTLQQVLSRQPLPPHRLQATVPGDLESICLRCLRKQPKRRYPTAEALAEDLTRFLAITRGTDQLPAPARNDTLAQSPPEADGCG